MNSRLRNLLPAAVATGTLLASALVTAPAATATRPYTPTAYTQPALNVALEALEEADELNAATPDGIRAVFNGVAEGTGVRLWYTIGSSDEVCVFGQPRKKLAKKGYAIAVLDQQYGDGIAFIPAKTPIDQWDVALDRIKHSCADATPENAFDTGGDSAASRATTAVQARDFQLNFEVALAEEGRGYPAELTEADIPEGFDFADFADYQLTEGEFGTGYRVCWSDTDRGNAAYVSFSNVTVIPDATCANASRTLAFNGAGKVVTAAIEAASDQTGRYPTNTAELTAAGYTLPAEVDLVDVNGLFEDYAQSVCLLDVSDKNLGYIHAMRIRGTNQPWVYERTGEYCNA